MSHMENKKQCSAKIGILFRPIRHRISVSINFILFSWIISHMCFINAVPATPPAAKKQTPNKDHNTSLTYSHLHLLKPLQHILKATNHISILKKTFVHSISSNIPLPPIPLQSRPYRYSMAKVQVIDPYKTPATKVP